MTIFDEVQALTNADQKTLSDCVVKVTEEVGELAKVVAAFAGLAGSRHKAGTQRQVLEESADTALAAMSIAFKAGCEPNELIAMMEQKLQYWRYLVETKQVNHTYSGTALLIADSTSNPTHYDAIRSVNVNISEQELEVQSSTSELLESMRLLVKPSDYHTARLIVPITHPIVPETEHSKSINGHCFASVNLKCSTSMAYLAETIEWWTIRRGVTYELYYQPSDTYRLHLLKNNTPSSFFKTHVQTILSALNSGLGSVQMETLQYGFAIGL